MNCPWCETALLTVKGSLSRGFFAARPGDPFFLGRGDITMCAACGSPLLLEGGGGALLRPRALTPAEDRDLAPQQRERLDEAWRLLAAFRRLARAIDRATDELLHAYDRAAAPACPDCGRTATRCTRVPAWTCLRCGGVFRPRERGDVPPARSA